MKRNLKYFREIYILLYKSFENYYNWVNNIKKNIILEEIIISGK